MSVALLERIKDDGVTLRLSPDGKINVSGPEAVVARWLSKLKAHKVEVIHALKEETRFTDWRIHCDQSEMWAVFPEGATRAQVEARYPEAVKVEPIQRPTKREATAAERAELWRLINEVLTDAPEEIGEAFEAALAEVDAALECWRSLAR